MSNVKTTTHALVSVIDLSSGKEVTTSTASLNAKFDAEYAKRGAPDDATRRYAGLPSDVAFVKGGGAEHLYTPGAA